VGRYVVNDAFAEQYQDLVRRMRGLAPQRSYPQRRQRFTNYPSGIAFFNNSGETIPAFGVMKVYAESTLSDSQGVTSAIYAVQKPDTTFARLYLVNGSDTVEANAYGTGSFVDLPDRVLYDSADGTPVAGQVWGPYPSSWKLRRHMYGFYVIGDVNSTDTHVRCLQKLVTTGVLGKTDASHAKSATGTVSVWKGDHSADSGANIASVYNSFAAVATTKWVKVDWNSETPGLYAAEC
jgi:hypothetical protein